MSKETLSTKSHVSIKYDAATRILHVDWTGDQTKESVIEGCEQILHYLKLKQCSKILNDNTHVTGTWLDASWWVAVDWFPRMQEAGCRLFAWVSPPNAQCRLSTDETLKFGILDVMVHTFQNVVTAEEWLRGCEAEMSGDAWICSDNLLV